MQVPDLSPFVAQVVEQATDNRQMLVQVQTKGPLVYSQPSRQC